MNQYIDIFVENTVNPLFIKAQRRLVDKNRKSILSLSSDREKNALIESLWLQEYSARLCYNEEKKCWDRIFFDDINKKMLFVLTT